MLDSNDWKSIVLNIVCGIVTAVIIGIFTSLWKKSRYKCQECVRRRQLLHEFAAAFAPPKRKKLYQLLHEFIPV